MNNDIDAEILKIIERVYPNETDERQMLEKVFTALAKRQENFLSDLEKRIDIETAAHDWNKDFEVAVKFVRRGSQESTGGLFSLEIGTSFILADKEETPLEKMAKAESFFVNAAYNEIENFCAPKKYHGKIITKDGTLKNFSYTLQRHERFINYEKILFEVAALYKISRPIIFSPYARKAVDVKFFGLEAKDFNNYQDLDLLFRENNLNGKILNGKLFWNVEIEGGERPQGGKCDEYIGADGNLIRYAYFHTFDSDKKIFVLPAQHFDDLKFEIKDNGKNFTLGYSSVLKEYGYSTLNFVAVEKISDDFFTNDFPRPNNKLRLRTEGDVEKVLSCFNATRAGKIFPAKFESFNSKNFKPLEIYRREDRYFISPEFRLIGRIRNKPICVISFGGNDSIFKIDYANYVIYYLEKNYPEFNWAGVET